MRVLVATFFALLSFLATTCHAQADSRYVPAFVEFIKSERYDQANFYILQGYIVPADLNPTQILYEVIRDRYDWNITDNLQPMSALLGYLSGVGPIDPNALVTCNSNSRCGFGNRLVETAQPLAVIKLFVDMGLDLNVRHPGLTSVDVALITHLGSAYSVQDLNAFAAMGLQFGQTTVSIQDLGGFQYDMFYDGRYIMPSNYTALTNLNLLDMIVMTLGSLYESNQKPTVAAKSEVLCDFAVYAAQSYTPSFDYLDYLLANRRDFRAENVGVVKDDYRAPYIPFPNSCVGLIRSMAASHARLADIMDRFAVSGDLATAEWLITAVPAPQ